MQDAAAKGRMRVPHPGVAGDRHPRAKATKEMAAQILAEYRPRKHGHGAPAIARRHGVSVALVQRILLGRHWTNDA